MRPTAAKVLGRSWNLALLAPSIGNGFCTGIAMGKEGGNTPFE
jgi:hypothetical protein